MTVWFTVQLDDRPGSLARVATALAERNVNITGIVGMAEDADGALMLTTSDAAQTRAAFESLGEAYEEHDPTAALTPNHGTASGVQGHLARGALAGCEPLSTGLARSHAVPSAAVRVDHIDRADAIRDVASASWAEAERVRTLSTVRRIEGDPRPGGDRARGRGLSEDAALERPAPTFRA